MNPVNTSTSFKLYSFAIASAKFDDTIVFIRAPFAGISPLSCFCESSYSAISNPDIFPVNEWYSPVFESFAYTPNLSASGSFARTTSAFTFFANSNASLKALSSSGFG